MKKLLIFLAWLGAMVFSLAQQKQYVYPLEYLPSGFDTYTDVAYYSSGDKILNLRNLIIVESDSVLDFQISPNGKLLALLTTSAYGDNHLNLYDLWEKNSREAKAKKLDFLPIAICFNPNGKQLVAADDRGRLHMLSVDFLNEISSSRTELGGMPKAITSSPLNQLSAIYNNKVEILSLSPLKSDGVITLPSKVKDASFSPDGKLIGVLCENGFLSIYNVEGLQQTHLFENLGPIQAFAFNADGKHLAMAIGRKGINIINLFNPSERENMKTDGSAIDYMKFVNTPTDSSRYLMYGTIDDVTYINMDHLSPLRSQLLANLLKEQADLTEQQAINQLAIEEHGAVEMKHGAYNTNLQLMALKVQDGVNQVLLPVPQNEINAFFDPGSLKFQNIKYALNDKDEFVITYVDVINNAIGKKYTYDNIDGKYLNIPTDEKTFAPLELYRQVSADESLIASVAKNVIDVARNQKIISDHTNISINTKIVPSVDLDGMLMQNYVVEIAYKVDKGYVSKDDFPQGKFQLDQSAAALTMMKFVKQILETDFAKYMQPGKSIIININSTADAAPLRQFIPYEGTYGNIVNQPIVLDGRGSVVTVATITGITDIEQLAFLRAVGAKNYLLKNVKPLLNMNMKIIYDINLANRQDTTGNTLGITLTFVDAF